MNHLQLIDFLKVTVNRGLPETACQIVQKPAVPNNLDAGDSPDARNGIGHRNSPVAPVPFDRKIRRRICLALDAARFASPGNLD